MIVLATFSLTTAISVSLQLQALATKKWWHGDLSKKKAESLLFRTKRHGRWLVRYSTYPGDFVISVLYYKKKNVAFMHHIVSSFDAPAGKYLLLMPPKEKDFNMGLNLSLEHDRKQLLSMELPCYDSIAALIKANKKRLGILKFSKFCECVKTYPPVALPSLTKVRQGTVRMPSSRNVKAQK